jgi:general secretion pathway protein M
MSALAAFWSGLSARERALIGVAAALALLIFTMMLIVRPLQSARAQALADIRTYETLNARIRAAGPGFTGASRREGAPAAVIAASAAEFGLAARPIAGGGMVRVVLTDAPFESLVRWVAEVERSTDLRVRSISIEQNGAPGRVSAAMSFKS